jgi:hypothetical protein
LLPLEFPAVVVVEVGAVVAVVEVGAVVAVVVEVGAVVAVVVEVVAPCDSEVRRLVMTEAGGFGTVAVAGTKAMVTSWPFSKRRLWGAPLVSVPLPLVSKFGQLTTMTTPGLPASGVPLGHTSPLT